MDDEKLNKIRTKLSLATLIRDGDMPDFNTTGHGYVARQLTTITEDLATLLIALSVTGDSGELRQFSIQMLNKMAADLTEDRRTSEFYDE